MTVTMQRNILYNALLLIVRKAAGGGSLDYLAGLNYAAGVAEGAIEQAGLALPPVAAYVGMVDIEAGATAFGSPEVKA